MAENQLKSMLKTRTYLQPNSSSMQKPIEGKSVLALSTTKSMLKKAATRKKPKKMLFTLLEFW